MAVMRVHKTGNYTVMSNYHFKEKDMSLKAKGLLSLMLSLPDTWDYTIAGLVSLSKDNITSVKSALKELEEFKYLVITKKMPNETESGRIEYDYDIYEKPHEQEYKKQDVENLYVESLHIENQCIENPALLSTNELNTNNKILNNKILSKDIKAEQAQPSAKAVSPKINTSQLFSNTKTDTKKKGQGSFSDVISSFSENKNIRAALNNYVEVMKCLAKATYEETGKNGVYYPGMLVGALKTLKAANLSEDEQLKRIQASTDNSWKRFVFEDEGKEKKKYRSRAYEDNLKGKEQKAFRNLSEDEKNDYFIE